MRTELSARPRPVLAPPDTSREIAPESLAREPRGVASSLTRLLLIFAITYTVLIMSPALLSGTFRLYPLMKVGDATDVLAPLVVLPLYWQLFRIREDAPIRVGENIAFLVIAAFWVEGHGMHLSANSIGHLLTSENGNAYNLAEFYDEVLSHYLWHIGMVGMTALLLVRQWRHPFATLARPPVLVVASLIYGFTYFVTVVEAQTAPIGVPFAVAVVLFGLALGRGEFRRQPLLTFFVGAQLLSLILFAVWGVYWGGLPEFSKVGIIS